MLAGQAMLRNINEESREDATLRALGAGAGHELAFALARAAVIAVPAAMVASAVAYASSAVTPVGWARELDPDAGLHFDAAVILPGAAAVVAVVVAVALVGAVRGLLAGTTRRVLPPPALPLTARVVRRRGSPAFAAGVRMAFGSGGQGARATVTAAVVAVAVCVTALTFAASFDHLTNTPRLYGQTPGRRRRLPGR